MQQLVEDIASSPAIRAALVRSTATLGTEVSAGLRRRMDSLDNAGERKVQGWLPWQSEAAASRTRSTR